ncbi:type I restriction endonuclease subunit R [Candidatus Poriferisocius sp.]|uniref:type I restriction endonuclease subunit R n=1 Tax=Candidatus Poriferisocius sp. TaxID=3101276 RepID=UPI003B027594
MTDQRTEHAFESAVTSMLAEGGWRTGDRAEWDVERALFPERVIAFVKATQPELWAELVQFHGDTLAESLMEQLVRELDTKGTLAVLRHGFRFWGKTLRLAYFRPAHGLNPDAMARFERNELTVTRQAQCHPGKGDTVDMLLALNGLPVATCELKNPMTGQSWRNAAEQYRRDRDPDAPLFRFTKRALVHFAADCDEVHMTTRLSKNKTRFLPFNRGSAPGEIRCGAGNPHHPSGYRSGYFWQEVLQRERFLDIVGSYIFVETRTEKVYRNGGARNETRKTLVFPRYHQLDAVTKLIDTARADGPGRNYLIQHSAGSGKTNSISWLSHRLSSLHTAEDEKVFDCVVVITDRRVLDQQLQEAVYQIEHAQGVVKAIDQDSGQLAEALVDGTKIVITTLQKFPFVMQRLLAMAVSEGDTPTATQAQQAERWRERIAQRNYAVIVDEAHSSQSGESAGEMKAVLGARSQAARAQAGADGGDWEDSLNAVVESRRAQPNLSFFAFTATPKAKTIELFGTPGASGRPEPFHVYSMRQAIEEEFILDVLGNYTDYNTYFRLLSQAEGDQDFPKRRTSRELVKFMHLHPHNLDQKTEVIVEHFRNQIRRRIGGKAKAMVVTSSRLHAVRYMQAFQRYITERGYTDIHPLVAFSGTVTDPDTGEEFTEPSMNIDTVSGKTISEAALAGRFDSPDYQILLVAEKYQTGFDQPLLQAMYVDKRLDGVQAVQTLSRLNRIAAGKSPPFVLDFVNDPEDIRAAFEPYYDQTQLQDRSDPYQLDRLGHELDMARVYYRSEVEEFIRVFYRPSREQRPGDHAQLEAALQPACDRFDALDDDRQSEFRDRLSAYVSLYAFLSQIIPYADGELERLYAFGKALLPRLRPDREAVHLADDIELEYYRLELVSSGHISLGEDDDTTVKPPTEVGTGNPEEPTAPLWEIIERLNDRFGTNFTESERLFFQQIQHDAINSEDIRRTALANPFDKFSLSIRPRLKGLLIERMAGNDALVTRTVSDTEFQEIVYNCLLESIFEAITTERHQPDRLPV